MHTTTPCGRTTMRLLLCSVLFLAVWGTLHAQRWELNVRGQVNGSNEVGWYGVTPVSTGGYIAVGSTSHVPGFPSWTCTNPNTDVLVVTITNAGAVGWMQRFDIGSQCMFDVGRCVIECAFGGALGVGGNPGDFVICGTTGATATGCTAGPTGSFVMRITPAGAIVWTQIYNANEIIRIVEATLGNALFGTVAGDLIFCGVNTTAGGFTGGFAARVTGFGAAPGTVIWDQQYFRGGYLNDIIESTVGVSAGDIITVGYDGTAPGNATMIRANGNTGGIGLPPQGDAQFGNTVKFRSVHELSVAPNATNLVVTGYTATSDLYILQTTANPCAAIVADIAYDVLNPMGGSSNELGESVWEVKNAGAGGLTPGNIVITGFTDARVNIDPDLLLLEVIPGVAGPPVAGLTVAPGGAGFHIYDVAGTNDWGYSVRPVYSPGAGMMPTDGFIICGTSDQTAPIPNNRGFDMYLIKTNNVGNSGCDNGTLNPTTARPALGPTCVNPVMAILLVGCSATSRTERINGLRTLCNSWPLPREATMDRETVPFEFDLAVQPNPVQTGAPLKLACTVGDAVTATITVSDVTGRTVATHDEKLDAGASTVELSTAGWSAGTYLITVTIDGRSKTERVVVSDR